MKRRIFGIILIFCVFSYLIPTATSTVIESFPNSEDNKKQLNTIKCGTMTILENLKQNQKMLDFGIQGFVTQALSESTSSSIRPTDPNGGIDNKQHLLPQLYNTSHFVLHWTNGTDGGSFIDAVNLTDTNTNGIPDFIESSGTIFEEVRTIELGIRGFPAPPSDINEPNNPNQRNPDGRYDIFIYQMQYYGYAYPEQRPVSPSYSFIAVENDFRGFYTQGLDAMRVTAAHEFFHAIQFYYDCTEESWWMETTATYMEDEVYPDINNNYKYLPSWFKFCDSYGLPNNDIYHQCGDFIFAKRLSEDFGDEIIRQIWTEMMHTDGLTAINNILVSKNSSFVDEFNKFIVSNFFLEDMYEDGSDYRAALVNETFKGVWLEYQYDASTVPAQFEINDTNANWDAWMDKWATDYITLKLDLAKANYKITFDGLDLTTNYLVKLATKKDGIINEIIFNLDDQRDGCLYLKYDVFDNLTLIIANTGNTNTARPSWRIIIEALSQEPPKIHDVGIVNITFSENPKVGKDMFILVMVENKGNFTETFAVSLNYTLVYDPLIGTQTITLEPGSKMMLNFSWKPIRWGEYEIKAYTSKIIGETNLEDNTKIDHIFIGQSGNVWRMHDREKLSLSFMEFFI